jgi:type II secretory pathway pseudopilin PulG
MAPTGHRMRLGRHQQGGFTYLWLLAAMAVLGFAMAAIGPLWATQAQREHEAELLRIGATYARAIEHYYALSPGGVKTMPARIDDLLLDPRFATPVRHLRFAYPDPIDPAHALEAILGPGGQLLGVRSTSVLTPLRLVEWTDGRHVIAPAQHYKDWQFLAQTTQ